MLNHIDCFLFFNNVFIKQAARAYRIDLLLQFLTSHLGVKVDTFLRPIMHILNPLPCIFWLTQEGAVWYHIRQLVMKWC